MGRRVPSYLIGLMLAHSKSIRDGRDEGPVEVAQQYPGQQAPALLEINAGPRVLEQSRPWFEFAPELDSGYVLHALVGVMRRSNKPERRPVLDREGLTVHLVGQKHVGSEGVLQQ